MFWVRYTVFVLLIIFVGTSIAANVLPLYHFKSSTPIRNFDTSVNLYVHTSTFYLWYQEVQLATDPNTNTVEFPETGGAVALPGKTKLILRLLASNMRNIAAQAAGDARFSHVEATCAALGRELLASAAMAVLGTVFGGFTLGVVAWGRGPSDTCLVPGWIAFALTFCAALCTLIALALCAHMRNNPICYRYAYSNQGYRFSSGFILLCVSFGGYAVTAAMQAMCPMCCCCCDGARRLDDDDISDSDKFPSGDMEGEEMEAAATSSQTATHHSSRMLREGEGKGGRGDE